MMFIVTFIEKCLENTMETAEYEGKEWIEEKERRERENKVRQKLECHNCGKHGNLKRGCSKPLVKCQFCKKRRHLIQFCYGKGLDLVENSNSHSSKK
uniref:CCHC-type domain-containing protein n=1 Tax=Strongyloides venezuelensis TaxID=75913 RepID=A0A0K0FTX8_STRVS